MSDSQPAASGNLNLQQGSEDCPLQKAVVSVAVWDEAYPNGLRIPSKVKVQVVGAGDPVDTNGGSARFPGLTGDVEHTVTADLGDLFATYGWKDTDIATCSIRKTAPKGRETLFTFYAWRRPTFKVTVKSVEAGNNRVAMGKVKVVAKHSTGAQVTATTADETGVATLGPLLPGRHDVSVELDDEQAKKYETPAPQKDLDMHRGEDCDLSFEVWRLTAVKATVKTVIAADKAAIAGVKVVAKHTSNASVNKLSAEGTGVALLQPVLPGKHDVSIELDEEQAKRWVLPPAQKAVDVPRGETKDLGFELLQKGTLAVEVKRADGVDLSQQVKVKITGPETRTADTVSGKVSFTLLAPGEYTTALTLTDEEAGLRITRTAPDNAHAKVAVPANQTTNAVFELQEPYKKIQPIAYYVNTGEYIGTDVPANFGDDPAAAALDDIKARCKLMAKAIDDAYWALKVKTFDVDVLKLFMAPEFYFRGKQGAYPIETVSQIMDEMKKTTGGDRYKDWLFVFGTALGYLKHAKDRAEQQATVEVVSNVTYVRVKCEVAAARSVAKDWLLYVTKATVPSKVVEKPVVASATRLSNTDPDYYTLKLTGKLSFAASAPLELWSSSYPWASGGKVTLYGKTKGVVIQVKTNGGKAPAKGWFVKQGSAEGSVEVVSDKGGNRYVLAVDIPTNTAFTATQAITLVEPGETEIFNVAQIHKGGPGAAISADGKAALKEVVVYKEHISKVDFQGPDYASDDFHQDWRHVVDLHGDPTRRVLPTEGSTDLGGKNPNKPIPHGSGTHVSEVNKSGVGGGSVVTIDGITFGVEVCRDHAKKRLSTYYKSFAAPGEPKVQVHLIPSCGISIKDPCCVAKGLVFNVDATHVALKSNGGTKTEARLEVNPASALMGVTVTKHFPKTENSATGYVMVYPVFAVPAAETV